MSHEIRETRRSPVVIVQRGYVVGLQIDVVVPWDGCFPPLLRCSEMQSKVACLPGCMAAELLLVHPIPQRSCEEPLHHLAGLDH